MVVPYRRKQVFGIGKTARLEREGEIFVAGKIFDFVFGLALEGWILAGLTLHGTQLGQVPYRECPIRLKLRKLK